MNLAFGSREAATKGAWLQLKHPVSDEPLGVEEKKPVRWLIAGRDSDQFAKYQMQQQTIRVQNALDDTQLRIEELQGQENLLDDRTSLATIRLRMREEGVEPTEVETPSLPNALERAVAGFVGMIAAIVIGIGYVIPFLLIALVAWFVVVRVRRRRGAV